MKNIFKYRLPFADKPIVSMPFMSTILSIQKQGEDLQIWAIVDITEPLVDRQFYILGTGDGIPEEVYYAINHDEFNHLATVQDGALVWHIFENTMPF